MFTNVRRNVDTFIDPNLIQSKAGLGPMKHRPVAVGLSMSKISIPTLSLIQHVFPTLLLGACVRPGGSNQTLYEARRKCDLLYPNISYAKRASRQRPVSCRICDMKLVAVCRNRAPRPWVDARVFIVGNSSAGLTSDRNEDGNGWLSVALRLPRIVYVLSASNSRPPGRLNVPIKFYPMHFSILDMHKGNRWQENSSKKERRSITNPFWRGVVGSGRRVYFLRYFPLSRRLRT